MNANKLFTIVAITALLVAIASASPLQSGFGNHKELLTREQQIQETKVVSWIFNVISDSYNVSLYYFLV
jgi:hypothetical protein